MADLIHITLAGNEVWRFIVFFMVVLLAMAAGRGGKNAMLRIAASPRWSERAWLAALWRALSRSIMLIAFSLGLGIVIQAEVLSVPRGVQSLFDTVTSVLFSLSVGYVLYCMADVVDALLLGWAGKSKSHIDVMLVPLVGKSVRITIVTLIVLQVIQSMSDKPITSVLAGLGVGGLAIALAGQDTIRNFFGSLVIIADKPFEIGERVKIDGHDGTIEAVGFRSTRIRTLDGHVVTVPNGELMNRTVQNISKRPFIKRVMNVTITYDTPPEKVARSVAILKELLDNHEGMKPEFPPRVFFNDFNAASLNIIVIYWYHPPDYWKYMEYSESLNMRILERFNAEGIDFAFPTQTVYLADDPKRRIVVERGV